MRGVPVNPEPEDALRARYPAALAKIYQLAEAAAERRGPGDRPEHVFDTLDGVRLIVSREQWPNGRLQLHVSASFHDHCAIELQQIRRVLGIRDGLDFMLRRFREISGDTSAATLIGLSEGKGVPHWVIEVPS
jgi:hypothetical protein